MKEANLLLRADNCIGHNKNNAIIHYFMWPVASGSHQSAHLSSMLVGYTKFAPDHHFGKKRYQQTRIDTISSIKCVVETSSIHCMPDEARDGRNVAFELSSDLLVCSIVQRNHSTFIYTCGANKA